MSIHTTALAGQTYRQTDGQNWWNSIALCMRSMLTRDENRTVLWWWVRGALCDAYAIDSVSARVPDGVTRVINDVVTTAIRLRFNARSTAYRRSLRSQWRSTSLAADPLAAVGPSPVAYRNQRFRRLNEPGPPSSWGPRVVGPQKNFRQDSLAAVVALVQQPVCSWRGRRLLVARSNRSRSRIVVVNIV